MIELPARSRAGAGRRRHHARGTPRAVRVRALLRNPSGLIGLVLITIPVTLALLDVSGLLPYDPAAQDAPNRLLGPSWEHWFGPTSSAVTSSPASAAGVTNSARIALVAVGLAAVIGTMAGLVAGFYRGVSDSVIGGVSNVLFAFPLCCSR